MASFITDLEITKKKDIVDAESFLKMFFQKDVSIFSLLL